MNRLKRTLHLPSLYIFVVPRRAHNPHSCGSQAPASAAHQGASEAGHRRAPRRPAADHQGGGGDPLLARPREGALRHRDLRHGRQHAGAHGRVQRAQQARRPVAQGAPAGRVHADERARRPPRPRQGRHRHHSLLARSPRGAHCAGRVLRCEVEWSGAVRCGVVLWCAVCCVSCVAMYAVYACLVTSAFTSRSPRRAC